MCYGCGERTGLVGYITGGAELRALCASHGGKE